ncbi:MAG: NAD-dependent epimerase/dehydratase family protein [Longimicrobiales bacterium]
MPRSLVTGAAGFIGSHVARHCLSLGHEVVALDDLSGGFQDNVPEGATFVRGSVTDAELVDDLFRRHDFDFIYHLAAYAAEGLSHFIRRFNYTNNVLGSISLVNAAVRHEVRNFVFTSSIAVYGTNQLPMTEDLTPRPEDPYGIAKYAVELDLEAAEAMFGLPYTIFRPHNVYGEGQNIGDRYRNVVGIFMNQIMKGEPMTVFGDGTQTRAFSHVDDVAPIIARSVAVDAARNEVFNIGADTPHSVNRLAEAVAEAFGRDPEIRRLPAREEVDHAYASHEKVHRVFGASDPIPLDEGIARMAEWARSVGPRRTPEFHGVEVWKDFPEGWRTEVPGTSD